MKEKVRAARWPLLPVCVVTLLTAAFVGYVGTTSNQPMEAYFEEIVEAPTSEGVGEGVYVPKAPFPELVETSSLGLLGGGEQLGPERYEQDVWYVCKKTLESPETRLEVGKEVSRQMLDKRSPPQSSRPTMRSWCRSTCAASRRSSTTWTR